LTNEQVQRLLPGFYKIMYANGSVDYELVGGLLPSGRWRMPLKIMDADNLVAAVTVEWSDVDSIVIVDVTSDKVRSLELSLANQKSHYEREIRVLDGAVANLTEQLDVAHKEEEAAKDYAKVLIGRARATSDEQADPLPALEARLDACQAARLADREEIGRLKAALVLADYAIPHGRDVLARVAKGS
jgi:hypothetical protein